MKITVWVQNTFLSILTPITVVSGTILSSKTQELDFDNKVSLDDFFKSENDENYWVQNTFLSKLTPILVISGTSCPPRLQGWTLRTK